METRIIHNYPLKKDSKNIYLYPLTKPGSTITYNPYFDDLIQSLSKYYNFINVNKPTSLGIFDFLKYIRKTDYLFLNWIEDIIDKKFGFVQFVFFIFLLPILKVLNIRIVYTLHNKISHYKKNRKYKKLIFKILLFSSSTIITHSEEGLNFISKYRKKSLQKSIYIPHPIKNRKKDSKDKKKFDILIWGKLAKYKNVHSFLEYLTLKNLQNRFIIKIIGKVSPESYYQELKKYESENISIVNKFINDDVLAKYISQSEVVLFTYNNASVLSSGALMDSLGYHSKIIGPDIGAFRDLKNFGICETYDHFDDLIIKLDQQLNLKEIKALKLEKEIESFIANNSWDSFAEKIFKAI